MPGAQHLEPKYPSPVLPDGKPRKCVWHVTDTAPGTMPGNINVLHTEGYEPNLLWDPDTGDMVQWYPANQSSRSLITGNEDGSIVVQIEVIGLADVPFTNGPLKGFTEILTWLTQLGIPPVWPAGPPPAWGPHGTPAYGYNNGYRDPTNWNQSGHFGHSNVPGNDHGDPGAINTTLWSNDTMTPDQIQQLTDHITAAVTTAVTTQVTTAVTTAITTQTELIAHRAANLTWNYYKLIDQNGALVPFQIGLSRILADVPADATRDAAIHTAITNIPPETTTP